MRSAICMLALLAAGGLWPTPARAEDKWPMATRLYADAKARDIGDLLTVLIRETSASSKEAESRTDKKNALGGSISIGHPRVDDRGTSWTNAVVPSWSLNTDSSFEGGGQMENKDELTATITVRVTEVLPNGNMLIEGKRSVVVNDEQLGFVLTGVVRPQDVTRENTIESTLIADAHIRYFGKGTLMRNQKKGILTRLWDWVNLF